MQTVGLKFGLKELEMLENVRSQSGGTSLITLYIPGSNSQL